jgi:hypothetical protein
MGGHTAPLLPQFCSSSFFHATGAPFKAPTSFNFVLNFLNVSGGPFKKLYHKVIEHWLYGALTGTSQLFSNVNTIFPPLRATNCLYAPARRREGNKSASHMPLEGGRLG